MECGWSCRIKQNGFLLHCHGNRKNSFKEGAIVAARTRVWLYNLLFATIAQHILAGFSLLMRIIGNCKEPLTIVSRSSTMSPPEINAQFA